MTGRGELIAGRYGLLARVGDGETDAVWQARDELLGRIVALRRLPPLPDDLAGDAGHRESWMAAQPRHPNAVTVHDAVEQSGRYYLVMEHFPARSLSELAEASGPLTEETVARIGVQVAGALAAAHDKGIAHLDITPANILVGSDGIAKIAGFGISLAHGDGAATGDDDAGFALDVFSLGATLHAALDSGQSRRRKPITMLRRREPLVDVLLWMRRREPGDRPTMQAAHDALAAVVDGRPTGAPRPEPEPGSARGAFRPALRSRRLVRAAVAAVVLLAAGVLAGTLILTRGGTVVTADQRSPGRPVTGSRTTEAPPDTTGSLVPTTAPTVTHPTMQAPKLPRTDERPETPGPTCVVRYHVTNTWSGGYQAEVTVVNKGEAIAGWTVRWALPADHTITNLWDGRLTRRGSALTVTNLDYNGRVPANGTTTFGYTAEALAATVPALACQSH